MHAAGRVAMAGAVLVLAAACSDNGREATTTPARPATESTDLATAAEAVVSPHPDPSTTGRADSTTTMSTTTTVPATTAPPRVSFPNDLSAIAGIAATFTYPGSPVGADVAQCIGDGLVHVFGRSKVEQLGFGIGRWTLLGFAIALGPWNEPDSTAVVDTFRVCTPDWEQLMVTTATSEAEHLDVEAVRCIAGALDDGRAREVFITLLDRPDDGRLAPALADLEQAYAGCITPAQLTSLALKVDG